MKDLIIAAVLVLIVGSACYYIYKQKRNGAKCIGCPSSGKCPRCNCGEGNNK